MFSCSKRVEYFAGDGVPLDLGVGWLHYCLKFSQGHRSWFIEFFGEKARLVGPEKQNIYPLNNLHKTPNQKERSGFGIRFRGCW